MKSIEKAIESALESYLRKVVNSDIKEVLQYREGIRYGGYCSTCSYEEQVMEITYLTVEGEKREYTWNDSFQEMIYTLDHYSE